MRLFLAAQRGSGADIDLQKMVGEITRKIRTHVPDFLRNMSGIDFERERCWVGRRCQEGEIRHKIDGTR